MDGYLLCWLWKRFFRKSGDDSDSAEMQKPDSDVIKAASFKLQDRVDETEKHCSISGLSRSK